MRIRHAFSQIARVARLSGNSKAPTSRYTQNLLLGQNVPPHSKFSSGNGLKWRKNWSNHFFGTVLPSPPLRDGGSKYSNVRLSFVDLRWAQLYVSLVIYCNCSFFCAQGFVFCALLEFALVNYASRSPQLLPVHLKISIISVIVIIIITCQKWAKKVFLRQISSSPSQQFLSLFNFLDLDSISGTFPEQIVVVLFALPIFL